MKNSRMTSWCFVALSALLPVIAGGNAQATSLSSVESHIPTAKFVTPDGYIGHPVRVQSKISGGSQIVANGAPSSFATLSNWAGQIPGDNSHTVQTAFGYFKMPAVSCNSTNDLFAPWVGLDGWPIGTSQQQNTVQQAGVAVSCNTGVPVYQAWWEMFPALPVYISTSTYPIKPNDVVAVQVNNTSAAGASTGSYTIYICNFGPNGQTKQGASQAQWCYQTTQNSGPPTSSAGEAVLESPSTSYPNFGTVTFVNLGGFTNPSGCSDLFYVTNPSINPPCAAGTTPPAINTSYAGYGGTTEVSVSPVSYQPTLLPTLLPYNATFTATYVHQ